MVDCFIDYVAKRADAIEGEVRRVDRHLKGGFDHMNGMLHEVLGEVRAGFQITNSKLDAAASATCNDSVFSVAPQEELADLRAQVAKLDEKLKSKDLIINQQQQLIDLLQAQLQEARRSKK